MFFGGVADAVVYFPVLNKRKGFPSLLVGSSAVSLIVQIYRHHEDSLNTEHRIDFSPLP